MSNYTSHKDLFAFHPGYYIAELVEESGLTQEDFAKRLDTTPKNLSLLMRGEQRLSADMAGKLSRMLGTSVSLWLNLQNNYDEIIVKINEATELEDEIAVLKTIGYGYLRDNFDLPNLPRKMDEQVAEARSFLKVASLRVLRKPDMTVSFRNAEASMQESSVIKANTMVQIATNLALERSLPRYNRSSFIKAVDFALTQTNRQEDFLVAITDRFAKAGVALVVVPDLRGSNTKGAAKRLGSCMVLMVNDRRLYADTFWFTLMHEAGHIIHGNFGVSFESETGLTESDIDEYAKDRLIDPDAYRVFVEDGVFTRDAIEAFANSINRSPGIVLGRLENDGLVRRSNTSMKPLRRKYEVVSI